MVALQGTAVLGVLALLTAAPLMTTAPVPPAAVSGLVAPSASSLPSGRSGIALAVGLPVTSGMRTPTVADPVVARTAPIRRTTTSSVPPRASRSAPSPSVRRGRAALASLDWPWQEVGFAVEFAPYRGRYLGLTDARTRTITIFVKRGQSEGDLRTTIAHELGHALDAVTGTEEVHRAYREVRGIDPDVPWYPCNRCDDLMSPAGDFAETFARWLVGPDHVRRTLAPAPDDEQLRALDYFFVPLSERTAAQG